jgi:hypothetical protein
MPIDKKAALEQIDAALKRYEEHTISPLLHGLKSVSDAGQQESTEVRNRLLTTLNRLAPSKFGYVPDNYHNLGSIAGTLKALRHDYEAGYLITVRELIHGETFANFLDMASHLLTEGYKDAAAVIAGGTLEQHLGALCAKHKVSPILTTISKLNDALYHKAYEADWLKVGNGDRLEAQRCRGADFELSIDLRRQLLGGILVSSDTWAPPGTLFVVAQIPDFAAEIRLDFADAKRRFAFGHVILRESSRYKTPQTLPQTGSSEELSERQRPTCQQVMTHRPADQRRGRDSLTAGLLPVPNAAT